MKVGVTIEMTERPGGKVQVLLERNTGSYRGGKLHTELFEISDNADIQLLMKRLRLIGSCP